MLQEENEASGDEGVPTWPPPGPAITRPQGFMGKISMGKGPGGRPVEWPPRPNTDEQGQNEKNLTTTYPSGFKFKDSAGNTNAMVVTSQPAFKISKPVRQRGDDKWPPKGAFDEPKMDVRELIRPKKEAKDYSKFFAQNALPHNYAGYHIPPGTQHFKVDEQQQDVEEEEEEEEEYSEEEEDEE